MSVALNDIARTRTVWEVARARDGAAPAAPPARREPYCILSVARIDAGGHRPPKRWRFDDLKVDMTPNTSTCAIVTAVRTDPIPDEMFAVPAGCKTRTKN